MPGRGTGRLDRSHSRGQCHKSYLDFMHTEQEKTPDALNRHLRDWRVSAPLPSRFQEQVWRRIEQEQAAGTISVWPMLQNALEQLLLRRRLAYSYLTLALTFGLVFGYWQAREKTSELDSSLGQRYVQSVDPYRKPGHL
jgi:hypothetical protein